MPHRAPKHGSSGAPEWTRTTTPFRAQALNLPRIPFRHGGLLASRCPPHPEVYNPRGPLSTARCAALAWCFAPLLTACLNQSILAPLTRGALTGAPANHVQLPRSPAADCERGMMASCGSCGTAYGPGDQRCPACGRAVSASSAQPIASAAPAGMPSGHVIPRGAIMAAAFVAAAALLFVGALVFILVAPPGLGHSAPDLDAPQQTPPALSATATSPAATTPGAQTPAAAPGATATNGGSGSGGGGGQPSAPTGVATSSPTPTATATRTATRTATPTPTPEVPTATPTPNGGGGG